MTPAQKKALVELAQHENAWASSPGTNPAWMLPGTMGETRIFGQLAKSGYASRRRTTRDVFEYRITPKGITAVGELAVE